MKARKLSDSMKEMELLYLQLSNSSYKKIVKEFISEKEQDILYLYFNQKLTFSEIGEKYNISGQYTSHILQQVFTKLRKIDYKLKNPFSNNPLENLNRSIDDLFLSVRIKNVLNNVNIKTVGELVKLTETELLHKKERGFYPFDNSRYFSVGKKGLDEIKEELNKIGLNLGMNLEEKLN
ncbi:MAG: hypothetical protein KJ623_00975 [Nanoarchaeota archaeon]|nr:hypothetical protein [Nanoarchaeota archaeon]MBU0962827.1 hypothetical protein [Nanoarchaeota archaeon]